MSTVAEIEAAIKALPSAERERLADDLPSILPELNGDAKWQRIIKKNPAAFSEMRDADFDRQK